MGKIANAAKLSHIILGQDFRVTAGIADQARARYLGTEHLPRSLHTIFLNDNKPEQPNSLAQSSRELSYIGFDQKTQEALYIFYLVRILVEHNKNLAATFMTLHANDPDFLKIKPGINHRPRIGLSVNIESKEMLGLAFSGVNRDDCEVDWLKLYTHCTTQLWGALSMGLQDRPDLCTVSGKIPPGIDLD